MVKAQHTIKIITADSYLSIPFSIKQHNFRYSMTVRLQHGVTPLLPQERFSIGGRYTVRGFSGESSLMGEKGYVLRNDFGWILTGSYKELYLGLDTGQVFGQSTERLRSTQLAGTALGFKGHWQGLNYDFFYGLPLYQPKNFKEKNSLGFSINYSF